MKTQFHKILLIAFTVMISLGACTTQRSPYSQQVYVDYQLFYDQLSPYGNWVDYPGYGYVWIPDAGYGFAPYATNGHWVMTEFGWTWLSNYRWGWAPFHYGRWDLDNRLGWFWVPDNVWGPAWVSWRRGGGYYGWAPLRPGMNAGYGGYWDADRWNFVRDRDFGRTDIHRHYINRRNYGEIIRNSSVINNTHVDRRRNTTYISGPDRDEVQRVTGRRFNSLAVSDQNRPGAEINKDQLRIYRPQVQSNNTRTQRSAPARVYSRDEVKPAAERRSSRLPDNTYTPNERREDKQLQIERRRQEQNQINERRQQKVEQRRQQIEQRQQDNNRQSRPLNQPKREERSQQIEQQQNQTAPQTPSNDNNNRPFGGRRR